MLARIADHSRIVNPTPSDTFVEQRRKAVTKLVEDEALEVEALEALVEIAAFGVPAARGEQHSLAAERVISAIQTFQPSFPADIEANPVDFRLVAALCVGERIGSGPTESVNVYLSSLVRSALLLQPAPRELYLAQLLHELVTRAEASLRQAADELRQRRPWPDKAEIKVAGADANAVAERAKAAFDLILDAAAANTRADREEIDTLWWVFGRRSVRTGEPFAAMSEGECAVISAVELCERMQMPPITTASHLLGVIVPDQTTLSLAKLAAGWRKESLSTLVQHKEAVATVLENHASLMPLTWLAARLLSSDMSPGWQHEFEKKTKLRADSEASPGDWARQIFCECVVRELAAPLVNT